ncbi:MAG: prepilin peptidase [Myxococcota bacterium]|nr:prepilin peptidase [Myxococcota bacterium]
MITESTLTFGLSAVAFFWGAAWGSFLNVVIYRLPQDLSVVRPGSHCPECGTSIAWYDNIPCLSYFILRGRCRACAVQFSPRYALVEGVCGLLVLILFQNTVLPLGQQALTEALVHWLWWQVFIFALVAITFIDLEHLFIPDEISIPTTLIGVAGAFWLPQQGIETALIGCLVGGGFMLLIFGIGWLIYRREALGLGDAKLMAMIGAFLGWKALPFVLFASSVQALVAVAGAQLYTRLTGRPNSFMLTTEELDKHFGEEDRYAHHDAPPRLVIPYGPFIALAALEATFLGSDSIWMLADLIVQAII